MEQAVREDVAALAVGGVLDLVHGQEVHAAVEGHGLHGADEVARRGGQNPLLSRDQGHRRRAAQGHEAVVVLAGQEAQGEADHARGVGEQALDGVVGLARVRGPEERDHGRHAPSVSPAP